ncbi:hypothetical protein ACJMK2_018744 [Sinanodonta woodiana]|uniref:Uncharacterized protein n=1 Tax=Sinanodonta woodiana TaxID=1069815 RepID=A0ABD3UH39_SINWO
MAFFNKKDIEFKQTGSMVTVADDPRAELMYYLNTICGLVDLNDTDPNLQRLRNYKYYYLTTEETERLLVLCLLLEPSVFINKCIFQSDDLCPDASNEFYEITEVNNHLLVAGNVLIGGRNRRVNKIMAFKMSWIQDYYYTPLNILLQQRQTRRQNNASACAIL